MGLSKKTNLHPRKFPGAKSPRPDNYKFRVEEATERQTAYDKLSIQERLDRLDSRLGKGVGARKQRARLELQLTQKNLHKSLNVSAELTGAKPKLKAKVRRAQEK